MLKSLKELFIARIEPAPGRHKVADLRLAAAVLMVEVGLADSAIGGAERIVMEHTLKEAFKLSPEEAGAIIRLAEQEADHAVSLQEFTRLLNQSLDTGEKRRLVEILWRVAFADQVVDKYEEYHIRKIADLLYVTHRDYIRAKHKAAERTETPS
ncbi:MAG: TerB family tellurite resistance protein [Gammaproteobacteria bacterium]|nr:MAG: TerB family tellurite resistance protein [Gammaproteobacteria bacterium]